MKNILYIDSSISENSRTARVCEAYIEKYFSGADSAVEKLKLSETDMRALDKQMLERRALTMSLGSVNAADFPLARQFAAADILLFGAPYYDFSFPALLKIYIENMMINGVTFVYDAAGIKSLCKAESMVYIATCGGFIEPGTNLGYEYVQAICRVLGVAQTAFISAQGLDIAGNDAEEILAKTIAQL